MKRPLFLALLFGLLVLPGTALGGIDAGRLAVIDELIAEALRRNDMPGAVVLVVHDDAVVWRKAYGLRARKPAEEAMTADTIFDLASLTKPVATATSVMRLIEMGKLRLGDRISQHLPEFTGNGKERLTVEQLLLHISGLIADNPIADYQGNKEESFKKICGLTPLAEPGARFIYSDVNFIILGMLVEKLSGKSLHEFSRTQVFEPLGMKDTGFTPPPSLRERIAPAELRDGEWMRGQVHDPRAYRLGGIAGHAGLFAPADDLARFARMLLNGGSLEGKQILSPLTVRLLTTARPVPSGMRALGWDVQTSYSANRGELFPAGKSFGHTGFTGTSIWLDPTSRTAVIFLSNRVHPDGKGNVTRIRGQVATAVAAALQGPLAPTTAEAPPGRAITPARTPTVLTGIDVLVREKFKRLQGSTVGLVTNHSGLSRDGQSTIDLLHKAEGVKLVALFSPEHGIRGAVDEKVADSKDEKTGLPVYSLYGSRRKPDAASLKGIDTLVYDIQDAGCRFYTYISTLGLVLEAAGENNLRVVVLDRPNPIGGVEVAGPMLDPGKESFVAFHRLPVRHGLTIGELATVFNTERKTKAKLEVVRMEGWRRGDFYDRTGLLWVYPSPNLRTLTAALLYPGVGLLETTNLSVGRGTDRPFEWIGAPWMDGIRLAAAMNAQRLPGLRFVPMKQTPVGSVHKGKECNGINIIIDDWSKVEPLLLGMTLATELRRLHPKDWQTERYNTLLGHTATFEGVKKGLTPRALESAWQHDLEEYKQARLRYLLYPE